MLMGRRKKGRCWTGDENRNQRHELVGDRCGERNLLARWRERRIACRAFIVFLKAHVLSEQGCPANPHKSPPASCIEMLQMRRVGEERSQRLDVVRRDEFEYAPIVHQQRRHMREQGEEWPTR